MTQRHLLALAKQGNPDAIAALLRHSLQPQGIVSEVTLRERCLEILLQAEQLPDSTALVACIDRGIRYLAIHSIDILRIYGQKCGETMPAWMEERILSAPIPDREAPIPETSQLPDRHSLELLQARPEVAGVGADAAAGSLRTVSFADLKQQARHGESWAIKALLDRALAHKGITTEVDQQEDVLHLLAEATSVPDQRVTIALIDRELVRLKLKIKVVKITGQAVGQSETRWSQEFQPGTQMQLPSARARSSTALATVAIPTFQLAYFIPYRETLKVDLYGNGTLKLLLFFSLAPLTIRFLVNSADLQATAWVLGIYYAVVWGVVLHDLIKPNEFSWRKTLACALLTTSVGIPILLMLQLVPPFSTLYAGLRHHGWLPRVIGFVLGVGVLEEACKALPIGVLAFFSPNRLRSPASAAFYGAMSGLGFAIAEGVGYSAWYASIFSRGESSISDYILLNTIRFISLPLFHAIWAGIAGYFIGLSLFNPSRRWLIMGTGVAIAAVLHGLYDVFSDTILGVLMMAFSILLFVTYLCRSQEMSQDLQQAELHCRTSSKPNRKVKNVSVHRRSIR